VEDIIAVDFENHESVQKLKEASGLQEPKWHAFVQAVKKRQIDGKLK
jgi:hypothetical protein